jgi:hypothetical protein
MKKTIASLACVTMIALFLVGCGWKPKVAAVPITAPWDKMNLPVKENAIVLASTEKRFQALHKDGKKVVLLSYVDALKSQGWVLASLDDKRSDTFLVDMTKGTDKIHIDIYDYENTGVIITKQ